MRSFRRLPGQNLSPAALALLVQVLAAGLALVCWLIASLMSWHLPLILIFFLQAASAVLLSHVFSMAPWWHCIHGIFPLAVWAMLQCKLPGNFYLGGLVLSVALFWTTFRSQVPFYPSDRAARELVQALLPAGKAVHVIDIGSGLGGVAMHLAAARPDSCITGIEIAPLPWLISRWRAWFRRSAARFRYGDYNKLDFAAYDVVFAYLSPAAMTALWQKASAEMRPGSLLISYEFPIENIPPSECLQPGQGAPPLFVWRM